MHVLHQESLAKQEYAHDALWLLTAAFQCTRVVYNQHKVLARAGLVSHLVGHVHVILWKGGKYNNTVVTRPV